MADLLIAIGGTGQHTALAVARLAFLGVLPRMNVAVIDSDDSNALSERLKTFGNTVGEYGEHPLDKGGKIYSPFDKGLKKDPEFQDLFLHGATSAAERDLFDLTFDETSADTLVSEGMFGRPTVGATIFAQNKDDHLQEVFVEAEAADRIFVTGSFVGGTGAGLIHQLVRQLPLGKRIYGIIFLPWFKAAEGGAKQTISNATMERNMRYGLDYFFKDTRPRLRAAMLLGLPDKKIPELQLLVKAGDLTEKPHFFHLAAAYGISQLPKITVTEQNNGSVYAAAYEQREQMYDAQWGSAESVRPLSWYVNRALFVQEILRYVSAPQYQYIEQVDKTFGRFWGFVAKPENIGAGLYGTLKQYANNERSTKLQEIARTWATLAQQYQFSLAWLDEVLGRFPKEKYAAGYLAVAGGNCVPQIQTLWKEQLNLGQTTLSASEVARRFHDKLVQGYQEN